MPLYKYKNLKTGQEFEHFKSIKEKGEPFILEDGTECKWIEQVDLGIGIVTTKKNKEVWEYDADYTRLTNPKYVRLKDGTREKYDPFGKHYGGKGVNKPLYETKNFPPGKEGKEIYKNGKWWKWDDNNNTWEEK